MPPLETDLRRKLENVVIEAREVAEAAARSALQKRAVDAAEPFPHFGAEERELRNRLRARGRQVGDERAENGTQAIDRLTQELAYESWHRMLFARFLAENHLLMHPDGVAVSLEECEELAPEADPPAPNGYVLAARYASTMLPQIFRTDDVLLEIEFAPEQRLKLEKLLGSLPRSTFLADDSLGWVYQFWQSKRKDEVNKSGAKIDGRTLSAVTQLFTEHYMVQFLLHNTIGAWWCARQGIQGPPGGAGVPAGRSPVAMEYLRWRDDGTPAAGTFEGWPKSLREFTMLDPCCGSGHFLVAAFNLLVPLRMHDEGLSAAEAVDRVLAENLHGLELDPRCTQIAAFALAMAAWKTPGDDGQPLGYRPLPPLNIACSGQGVVGSKAEWIKMGSGDKNLIAALGFLYDEFRKAPTLGSLINPRSIAESMFQTGFATLRDSLDRALRKSGVQPDPEIAVVGVAAQGVATAAALMARQFTLVATNVPYLARGKQSLTSKEDEKKGLRHYLEESFPLGKADLATAFVERCLEYCSPGGSTGLVTPQNWLFLGSYEALRAWMLRQFTWNVLAKLGPAAFEDMNWWAANTLLSIHTAEAANLTHNMLGLDASNTKLTAEKARLLSNSALQSALQGDQLNTPDCRIVFGHDTSTTLLSEYVDYAQGLKTGDDDRWKRNWWEFAQLLGGWEFFQSTVKETTYYSGREYAIDWRSKGWEMAAPTKGARLMGSAGIVISQMRHLPATLYQGHRYDSNVSPIVPRDFSHLTAIWCFCKSVEFASLVRRLDQKTGVTNATLVKVPFDLDHWLKIAAEEYPNGLPSPHSDDPTQWLFKGHPKGSTDPLQVAVARLLGYRWPDQEPDGLDALADADGIVPLPAVRTEPPAADRLREVLQAAYGAEWSASLEDRLLVEAGAKSGTSLDDWLRNSFFEKHCARFHQRPFVWHIWDGRKDGFACLVNYHKLTHKALENLTYSYLGDWITAQSRSNQPGADLRLAAAQSLQARLKLILAGEPPHDLFVRWKPLHEQAIGWNPDLNDGVRMNIRPFIKAEVLRKSPNIKWTKDRGKEPERPRADFPWFWSGDTFLGDRVNDVHLTNAEKQASRDSTLNTSN